MKFREYESAGGGEFELDPFQEEAIAAVEGGRSVLVAAPTGAGKTVIAEYAVELALDRGEQILYTAPIKALSNQKFRDFRSRYGDKIGILTGDVTINGSAPVLIMTTEIFRNALFAETGRFDDARFLVFDEVHYINDLERGTVWEESIIFAPPSMQLVCLSATMPNVGELAGWISEVRDSDVRVIRETHRPVPLRYFTAVDGELVKLSKLEKAIRRHRGGHKGRRSRRKRNERSDRATEHIIDELTERERLPCIYFCFSRAACEAKAWHSVDHDLLTDEERGRITGLYGDLCGRYGIAGSRMARDFGRMIRHGIAYHHAGMLPTLKEVTERLFSSGCIKLIFTTETFAVGINMPARTVAFDSLQKYDGVSFGYMKSREYHQMAGRAGRRGMDKVGYVYARVDPEEDGASGVRRVLRGKVERIQSRFELAYSAILNLYARVGEAVYDACANSFAMFQRRHHRRPDVPPEYEKDVAKKKLAVLRTLDYIDEDGLKRRGRMAAKINGYEMIVTELHADGLFHAIDDEQLAILMVAMVYEPRRRAQRRRAPKKVLRGVRGPAREAGRRINNAEKLHELDDLTKPPEFGLSRATWQWGRGCAFEELERHTNIAPGDVVRNFRLAIQLLRQMLKATKGDFELAHKLRGAIDRLDRDEVDAERQLRVE
ncbi:MAG: DEAD/DEAH box helicase [Planctomycetota bacterium]